MFNDFVKDNLKSLTCQFLYVGARAPTQKSRCSDAPIPRGSPRQSLMAALLFLLTYTAFWIKFEVGHE
jgi:hypothetical protein